MTHLAIWIISFLTIAAVIGSPFRISEAIWALTGAALLIVLGLLLPSEGLSGVLKGTDVYLFLTGMMFLSETAREEGLFDWLAQRATALAGGSAGRLFLLIYAVGTLVTLFLSNDATAVVLTPAVAAAVRAAKVEKPLPYLLICAFIANAASFVLPISNPANLVVYGRDMPSLGQWVPRYILPSLFSIGVTFLVLRFTQRATLRQKIASGIRIPTLRSGGRTALTGIAVTAIVLLASSALSIPLGLPTAIAGILTSAIVIIRSKKDPWVVIKGVSWSVIPLVAGLFVIVQALDKTGLSKMIAQTLQRSVAHSTGSAVWGSGFFTAIAANLLNNLPAGLIAGNAIHAAHVPGIVRSSILIGIDLGPNLSVSGSLATILWLLALRREGQRVDAWTFLKLGVVIMIPALFFAIAALYLNFS
jgi:arsenical pump membrane protein